MKKSALVLMLGRPLALQYLRASLGVRGPSTKLERQASAHVEIMCMCKMRIFFLIAPICNMGAGSRHCSPAHLPPSLSHPSRHKVSWAPSAAPLSPVVLPSVGALSGLCPVTVVPDVPCLPALPHLFLCDRSPGPHPLELPMACEYHLSFLEWLGSFPGSAFETIFLVCFLLVRLFCPNVF